MIRSREDCFRRALLFLAVAILATPFLQPDVARAAHSQSASFNIGGSNGFTVDVSGQGGRVTVIASEGRPPMPTFTAAGRLRSAGTGNGASTVYSAPAIAAGPGVVDADLGTLGRIAVSFRPSGERTVTTLRRGCDRPTRFVRRLGTFVGTIRFQGEQGYTTVAATSAAGSVGTPVPTGCVGVDPAGPPRSSAFALARPRSTAGAAVLTAVDGAAGSSFRAAAAPGGVSFHARVEERNPDGVTVVRHAAAGAPLSAFEFDRSLTWATVRPPAPFSGSARFAPKSGAGWTGSLRVTFPGLSVPLTGAGFHVRLARP
jgi:hypothetical protein